VKLFHDEDQRKQAIVGGSAVALHAIVTAGHPVATPEEREDAVTQAYELSLEFWRCMERVCK
jgi:hypothetical protein